jgi:hypothetical protein
MVSVTPGMVLLCTGLLCWLGGVYIPAKLVPGVTDSWIFQLALVLTGMISVLVGLRFDNREQKKLAEAEEPAGFEVKTTTGKTPVTLEERENDHG